MLRLGKFISQVTTGHLLGCENGGGWWGGSVKWPIISSSDENKSIQSGQPIWVNFNDPSTCLAGSPFPMVVIVGTEKRILKILLELNYNSWKIKRQNNMRWRVFEKTYVSVLM